jgi:acyl-CoA dehydrogenase
VQIHGGDGVRKGHVVERLSRNLALRIHEGASDVQKVIIAVQTLANLAADTAAGG